MYKVVTADYVKVCVTNSQNNAVAVEQKYAKDLLIDDLKVGHNKQEHTRKLLEIAMSA